MADRSTASRDRQPQPSVWFHINPSRDERHDLDFDSVGWFANRFLRVVEPVQEEVPQTLGTSSFLDPEVDVSEQAQRFFGTRILGGAEEFADNCQQISVE